MKIGTLFGAAAVSTVATVADAASAEQWRGRAIYQLLTDRFARTDGSTTYPCNTADGVYCGGTWRGIINHLDYIKNMGFTAIWISPVTYQIPDRTAYGYAYHGFWQQDLYRLNDNFGTADDLRALSQALHDRDMYLMVDVVANHFGWNGPPDSVSYSQLHPFSDAGYFHSYCPISDYSNQTEVEDCWLGDTNVPLPDLRTEDQDVQDSYNYWINQLVSNYSIDGLRIDTVKHVGKDFWSSFQSAAGVYALGEVYSGDPVYTCGYQGSLNGVFNYPLYFPFVYFLNSTSGSTGSLLYNWPLIRQNCQDVSLLGVFSENHDVPRWASQTQDYALAKSVLAITLMWDGIPSVYAGQEQHYDGYADPANREATWLSGYSTQSELYNIIAALNEVRNYAIIRDSNYLTYDIYPIYSDDHTVALRKGFDDNQIISVITNLGSEGVPWTLSLQSIDTGWSAGTQVFEILTCQTLTVDGNGALAVSMNAGEPRIYFSVEAAADSPICGGGTASGSLGRRARNAGGTAVEERRE